MQLDLEKVRIYAKKADNRALLDRVTVFQQGMEPAAIEIIKIELFQRGISPSDISQHESIYKDLVIRGSEGMPRLCKKCALPAISLAHSYPQLSGGVVRAEETCALNEQVKRKPSPPKDFHSWSRITIAPDVATSFSH